MFQGERGFAENRRERDKGSPLDDCDWLKNW
jgi:hypothetical protein